MLKDTKFKYYSGSSNDLASAGYKTAVKSGHLDRRTASDSPQKPVTRTGSLVYDSEDRWTVSGGSCGPSSTQSSGIGSQLQSRTIVSDGYTPNDVGLHPAIRRRRRRSVTSVFGSGGDSSASSTSSVCWSEERCTVQQVYDMVNGHSPVIVRACSGYSGRYNGQYDFELAVGQVLQVYAVCNQTRLYVSNCNGRQMSLPYDVPISVRPRTASGLGSLMRLSDAVSSNPRLPFTVSVAGVARCHPLPPAVSSKAEQPVNDEDCLMTVSARRHQLSRSTVGLQTELDEHLTGTDLTVTSVYQCRQLVAHVIRDDWLESRQVVLIPEDLSVKLQLAEGLEGATTEEWKDYCGMFARSARHMSMQVINGYEGLYYLDYSGQQPPAADDGQRLNVEGYKISCTPPCRPNAEQPQSVKPRDRSAEPRVQYLRPASRDACSVENRSFSRNQLMATANHQLCPLPVATKSTTGRQSANCSPMPVRNQQLLASSSSSSNSSMISLSSKTGIDHDAGGVMHYQQMTSKPEADMLRRSSDPTVNVVSNSPSMLATRSAANDGMTSFPPTNYPRMGKRDMIPSTRRKSSCARLANGEMNELRLLSAETSSNQVVRAPALFGGSMPSLVHVGQSTDRQLPPSSLSSSDKLAYGFNRGQRQMKTRVQFSIDSAACSDAGESVDAGLNDDGYCTKDSSTSVSTASSTGQSAARSSSSRLVDIGIGSVYF